ncbi:Aluminum induced protein with YGL and LRDR motif [Tripterygium wilfordii]|uniref:Aluminum induced protein with YGL and LRDR motif n=1 Tax=Tripterygium wilfordii TaxID=458696 RepID=A0A7J7CS53_TRIWF|nr:Aluminum induced protein with YGL and LRDR motif [Tripterygium wilfordii]
MLGVFSSAIVSPPDELVAAGCRTPSPKMTASALVNRFLETNASSVSVQIGDHVQLAYTHKNESPLQPRSFAVKDDIFCLFEGVLDNLGSLRQQYGLAKSANEVILVIEAYKTLRDRAPYPANHVVGHLSGNFAFIVFDKSTSTLFVASDQFGKVPLYWGITADGYVAFANDAELLKGACGKSLASFPQGCFFSTAVGELRSYENPKNRITAVPAREEEIWGATFKVKRWLFLLQVQHFLQFGLDISSLITWFTYLL